MRRERTRNRPGSAWDNPEDFITENLAGARAGVDRSVKDATAYAQLNPEKALMWAVGGGYLLRMLPLTGILGGLIRVILRLLKPAALIYGVAKVWQKARPVITPRRGLQNQ